MELETPASDKTAYAIYSITKTFTAVAAMMLVEGGKVSLTDPISKHLPDLPAAWKGVTASHILTHASGLPLRGILLSGMKLLVYTAPAFAAVSPAISLKLAFSFLPEPLPRNPAASH